MQASLSVVDITLPNSIYTYIKAMSPNISLKVKAIVIIYQAWGLVQVIVRKNRNFYLFLCFQLVTKLITKTQTGTKND